MATLIVPVTDLALDPLPNIEIFAYVSDVKGNRIDGATSSGLLVGRAREVTDNSGIATFDLVPNSSMDQDGTYYGIDVAGSVAPVVIYKDGATQVLSAARVFDPEDLELAGGLDWLSDVDLTGLAPGNTLRYLGGLWIPHAWPSGTGGGDKPWVTHNASGTLSSSDAANRHKCDASGGPITLTLPTAVGIGGSDFVFKRVNSGPNTTINTTSSQGIDGSLTFVLTIQFEAVTLSSDGANWMVI